MTKPILLCQAVTSILLASVASACGSADRSTRNDRDTPFPIPNRASLLQMADTMTSGTELAVVTTRVATGPSTVVFDLFDARDEPLRARVAVYWAPTPNSVARGPAPATPDRHRKGRYTARLSLDRPGRWFLLVGTPRGAYMLGSAGLVTAGRRSQHTYRGVTILAPGR